MSPPSHSHEKTRRRNQIFIVFMGLAAAVYVSISMQIVTMPGDSNFLQRRADKPVNVEGVNNPPVNSDDISSAASIEAGENGGEDDTAEDEEVSPAIPVVVRDEEEDDEIALIKPDPKAPTVPATTKIINQAEYHVASQHSSGRLPYIATVISKDDESPAGALDSEEVASQGALGEKKGAAKDVSPAITDPAPAAPVEDLSPAATESAPAVADLIPASVDRAPDARMTKREPIPDRAPTQKEVLWSKNWWNFVECEVDQKYYLGKTEQHFKKEEMIDFFQHCDGGVLYVRISASKEKTDLHFFANNVLPKITRQFTLISSDGVQAIPGKGLLEESGQKVLAHPMLKNWFAQNWDGTVHDKLHPIPLGFDLHSKHLGGGPGLKVMISKREEKLMNQRNGKMVYDGMGTNPYRKVADSTIQCIPHDHKPRSGVTQVWDHYSSYTFGMSPRGTGQDCHRTWEMMWFGMIPILLTSSLDPLFEGMPAIIVQDWKDLCKPGAMDWLREKEKQFKATGIWPARYDKFYMRHWLEKYDF